MHISSHIYTYRLRIKSFRVSWKKWTTDYANTLIHRKLGVFKNIETKFANCSNLSYKFNGICSAQINRSWLGYTLYIYSFIYRLTHSTTKVFTVFWIYYNSNRCMNMQIWISYSRFWLQLSDFSKKLCQFVKKIIFSLTVRWITLRRLFIKIVPNSECPIVHTKPLCL